MIIYDTIANKNSVILKNKVMAYYTTKNQATGWVKDGLHQFLPYLVSRSGYEYP